MGDRSTKTPFLASLVRAVRDTCLQDVSFKNRIYATGIICLDVDGEQQTHYVINELIRKVKEDESSFSFCLKTIDASAPKPRGPTRSLSRDIKQGYNCVHTRRFRVSPKRKTSGRWPISTNPCERNTQRNNEKDNHSCTRPCMLANCRHQKANRTFTIESEDEAKAEEIKISLDPVMCHSLAFDSPRPTLNVRKTDSYSNGNSSCSTCSNKVVQNIVQGKKNLSDSVGATFSITKKRANFSPRYQTGSIINREQNKSKLYELSGSDDDLSIGPYFPKIENEFHLLENQEYHDSDLTIASTKPPDGFVQRNFEPFYFPGDIKSEMGTPPVKKPHETISAPNFVGNDNDLMSDRENISHIVNDVISVLSQTKDNIINEDNANFGTNIKSPLVESSNFRNNYHQQSHGPESFNQRSTMNSENEFKQMNISIGTMDTYPVTKDKLGTRNDISKLKEHHGLMRFINEVCNETMKEGTDITESPSVIIKKKAKFFKWKNIFKKESSPQRLRNSSPLPPMSESHTSVGSAWSTSKRIKTPINKKRHSVQTR